MKRPVVAAVRKPFASRAAVIAAVMAVVGSYGVVSVVPAYAASLTGSTFEIDDPDANLVVDGVVPPLPAPAPTDWTTGAGAALRSDVSSKADEPSGGSDNGFTNGSHEDSDPPSVGLVSATGKADLTNYGLLLEQTPGDAFVHVFFTRAPDKSGDTNMDFQFNKSKVVQNGGSPQVIPKKTVGDIIITFDFTNGGGHPVLARRTWTGTTWSAAVALSSADALGSVNTSAIPAAQSGGLGALVPFQFGEASLRLSALIPPTVPVACTTFGQAFVTSRSSDSFSASLQDFIAPEPISISNCGSVEITKTDANGPLLGAEFTLYQDAPVVGGVRGANDVVQEGLPCSTPASGICTITDVHPGPYWLVETVTPAGHDTVAPTHVVVTGPNDVQKVALDDPIQTGTVIIKKAASPSDGTLFGFTFDGTSFDLADGGSKSFTRPIGSYTATEGAAPAGWSLTGLVCVDPTKDSTPATSTKTATASIALAKGETVTCTYTNAYTAQPVGLSTTASATAGGASGTDVATLTGDGTHPVAGSVSFFACGPTPAAADCTSAVGAGATLVDANVPVTHTAGASYTAGPSAALTPTASGWYCFRAAFTSSNPYYADNTQTDKAGECFLKQAQDLTVTKTATAAFGRHYSWTIDKTVDQANVSIPAGSSTTAAYTVTVGSSHVDSAWTVTGNVTVQNPNAVDFTGVTVTDAIDNGAGTCAVTGGTNAVVPALGSLVLAYTCTYPGAPTPSAGTNTATATWSAATYFTPHSTASGTAKVDFATVTPSTSDQTVTLSDTVHGSLGTLDAATMTNPTVFHYTVNRAGVAGTCTPYDNTASYTTNSSKTTGSSSARVTICVGSDLTAAVTATGSKDRDDAWSITKDVDKTKVNVAQGGSATFTYQVTVTPTGSVDGNFALTGVVTATNPNDWEPITATLTVTSDVGGGVSCAVTDGVAKVIAASGSITRPYSCTFTGTPAANGTLTATVAWNGAAAHTPSSSATATKPVSFPLGTETHKTVTVVDDKTDAAHPVTLGTRTFADGPHTYTYSLTKAGVDGECATYTNTASLTETGQSASKAVTVCVGLDLTVTKSALATNHRTFLWTIAKDVDQTSRTVAAGGTATFAYGVTVTPAGTTDDGWSVTGQITVTNPNKWESVTADITDTISSGGGASCVVDKGKAVTIAAQATVTLTYACTFTSKPADGTNTATATWDATAAATAHGTATGTAVVTFVPSSKTNETITVIDDKTDPANPVTLGTATYGAGPQTFRYTIVKSGAAGQCTGYTNTAVIRETNQAAAKTVSVCVGQALTVATTSAGGFDRLYLWTIDKAVDTPTQTVAGGSAATFTYTVTATPGDVADSGYALTGSVTVTNPNTWEAVTADTTVTTDVGGNAACTVTDGTGRSVPAGGSLVLPFSCAFTGAPATSGTLTALSTWNAAAAATGVGSAQAVVPAVLALGSEVDKTVTVTDDQTNPGHPVVLGTVSWGDGPTAFTYELSQTATGSGFCSTSTNTATLVETEQTASADAQVCSTVFTGGGGTVVPPQTGGGGGLAFTGDFSGLLARWALGLLLAGGLLVLLGRRRSQA